MWRNAVSDECPVPKSSSAIGNPLRRRRARTATVASGSCIAMLSVISSPIVPGGANMRSSTAAIRSGKSSERRLGPEMLMQTWTSNPFAASRRFSATPVSATHIVSRSITFGSCSAAGMNCSGGTSPNTGSRHRTKASARVTACPTADTIGCRCNSIRPASIASETSFDETDRGTGGASAAAKAAEVGLCSIAASTSRTCAARVGFSIVATIDSPSDWPICCAEVSTRASNPLISTMAPG